MCHIRLNAFGKTLDIARSLLFLHLVRLTLGVIGRVKLAKFFIAKLICHYFLMHLPAICSELKNDIYLINIARD